MIFIIILAIIWLVSILFNIVASVFELKKNYKTICINDIFVFLLFGIIIPFFLSSAYIEEYWGNIKYKQFKNPFYKG